MGFPWRVSLSMKHQMRQEGELRFMADSERDGLDWLHAIDFQVASAKRRSEEKLEEGFEVRETYALLWTRMILLYNSKYAVALEVNIIWTTRTLQISESSCVSVQPLRHVYKSI
jgi:hypothetical protein